MSNSIPKIKKSKSKIKPLQDEIFSLVYKNEALLEEMYENGTRIRPTIMSQIEEKEAMTLSQIKFCISECEKETGRAFPSYLSKYIKEEDLQKQYSECPRAFHIPFNKCNKYFKQSSL